MTLVKWGAVVMGRGREVKGKDRTGQKTQRGFGMRLRDERPRVMRSTRHEVCYSYVIATRRDMMGGIGRRRDEIVCTAARRFLISLLRICARSSGRVGADVSHLTTRGSPLVTNPRSLDAAREGMVERASGAADAAAGTPSVRGGHTEDKDGEAADDA